MENIVFHKVFWRFLQKLRLETDWSNQNQKAQCAKSKGAIHRRPPPKKREEFFGTKNNSPGGRKKLNDRIKEMVGKQYSLPTIH